MDSVELMAQATTEWEASKQSETLRKVLLIKKAITDKPVDEWQLDSLVNHVFTLTKIMDNLSELKDLASLQSEVDEEAYKSAVREEYLSIKGGEEKVTDKMAEQLAESRHRELKQREIKSRYNARVLADLYKDSERLINFTQTKVKALVDSQVRSNIG